MSNFEIIAKKVTYSLDGYIHDYNERNFGDADQWLRHVRNAWEEFIEAHPGSRDLHEYINDLQKQNEALANAYNDAHDLAILYRKQRDDLKEKLAECVKEVDDHYRCVKNLTDDTFIDYSIVCSLSTAKAMRDIVYDVLGVKDENSD